MGAQSTQLPDLAVKTSYRGECNFSRLVPRHPIGFGRAILGKNSSDFKRRDAESVVP